MDLSSSEASTHIDIFVLSFKYIDSLVSLQNSRLLKENENLDLWSNPRPNSIVTGVTAPFYLCILSK